MFYKSKIKIFITIALLKISILHANWPEETLQKLSLDEKIGQLFISAVIINPDINDPIIQEALKRIDQTPVAELITKYHVGGIIFDRKTTTPKVEYNFINKLQKLSNIELLIAQDLEWGLDMRLNGAIKFPYNITLGSIKDNELIYKLGKEIGRQCQMIGVNFNLAPVCDVNTNEQNPVINHRSFGENQNNVAQKSIAFMLGLQAAGLIACAKHFPGHGDARLDSHLDLPLIEHDLERLKNIELYPFDKIIEYNIMSIMIGHLQVPAIEPEANTPATISYKITTELLKKELGFAGLVITDALNMEGALKYYEPGKLELKALIAGADILLSPRDTPLAIATIKEAIINGELSESALDKKVLKILKAKEWIAKNKNLNNSGNNTNSSANFMAKLNSKEAYELNQKIYKYAVTLVQNTNDIIPLSKKLAPENSQIVAQEAVMQEIAIKKIKNNIACVQISDKKTQKEFFKALKNNLNFDKFYLSNNATIQNVQKLIFNLKKYETIIIGLYNMNNNLNENFGINDLISEFIKNLSTSNNIILAIFGNPYSLKLFENYNLSAIIEGYEEDINAQNFAAKIITGEIKPFGTLPVSASKKYYASLGLTF
ncbi:MAG: Glycoside hydrolase family 3 domain protein [candidate division TM6 bacterium GW2011_GWF2_30_66]|jgi:beta-glucosidase-like glycosyl hydrolase|nr:MAG: Glycoside hydrolase family 3 domain protein [candidate division TM6 bacterium GW2011_GWF2_30_66]